MHHHHHRSFRSAFLHPAAATQQRPQVGGVVLLVAVVIAVGCYLLINVTLHITLDQIMHTEDDVIVVAGQRHHHQQQQQYNNHMVNDIYHRRSTAFKGATTVASQEQQHDQHHQHHHNKEEETKRRQQNFLSSLGLLLRKNKNNTNKQTPSSTTTTTLLQQQQFKELYGGFDLDRIHATLNAQRIPLQPNRTVENMPYDIYNCPNEQPPPNYPMEWNALEVLEHWSIDQTNVPADNVIYQGLCVFDWENVQDRPKVELYRQAEVPFVLQNHPQILQTTERWSTEGYLEDLIPNDKPIRNEHAVGNHFMFWRLSTNKNGMLTQKRSGDWKAPTEMVELTYKEWKQKALELEHVSDAEQIQREHWYFRLNAARIGDNQANDFLYDELPFFDASDGISTLFMVDPHAERGINCRFGMKGVFAESHFDPTRNWIVLLKGRRRYLLAHPKQCRNLQLYPMDHPSGRHSQVDWSRPADDIKERPELAGFAEATLNEVVLQAGDALYLPTSWFHAIVSLNLNYQCNARSGMTLENMHYIHECGFGGGSRQGG